MQYKEQILQILNKSNFVLSTFTKPINYISEIPTFDDKTVYANIIFLLTDKFDDEDSEYFKNHDLYRFFVMHKIKEINSINNGAGFDEQFKKLFDLIKYGATSYMCPTCNYILATLENQTNKIHLSTSIALGYQSAIIYDFNNIVNYLQNNYANCTLSDLKTYSENSDGFIFPFQVSFAHVHELSKLSDQYFVDLYKHLNLKNIKTIEDVYLYLEKYNTYLEN